MLVGLRRGRGSDGRSLMHEVHVIIGAMMKHKDDLSVQQGGCGALWNRLMAHPEDKRKLVMAGAASVVAAASKRFWGVSAEMDNRANGFFSALFREGNTGT